MSTYLYLTSLIDDRKGSMNQLEVPVVIARVIPTPTVMHGAVIYMFGTTLANIEYRLPAKTMEPIFDPPLEKDVDYMLNTRSSTHMQLMLRSGKKWRAMEARFGWHIDIGYRRSGDQRWLQAC